MGADWIAVEQAGERLTGWAVSGDGVQGEGRQAPDLPALRALLGEAPMLVAGLDGNARSVPCTPLPEGLPMSGGARIVPPLFDARLASHSAGAETRIAGFLAARPDWDGVICVTGNSHVWALVSADEVVSFQGFATGRLVTALALGAGWAGEGFDTGLSEIMSRPERLAAALTGKTDRCWGALIGAELAAARAFWLGQQVAVIGDGAAAQALSAALHSQGVPVERAGGLDTLIAGLDVARHLPEA